MNTNTPPAPTTTVELTISSIGAPDDRATITFPHPDAARVYLEDTYGRDALRFSNIHGTSGSIGSMTGRVFQASRTFHVDRPRLIVSTPAELTAHCDAHGLNYRFAAEAADYGTLFDARTNRRAGAFTLRR